MEKIQDEKLIELYNQGLTQKEIAQYFECANCTVSNRLSRLGIKTRTPIDKSRVEDLHNQGLSDEEISDIFGCTRTNITHILNKMGYTNRRTKIDNIELRNRISQKLIGRYVGELNPNYKGYTDEKTIARGLFKTISKRLIRERGYTCEHCHKHGGDLETHHIKPFSEIFETFITQVYNGNISTIYSQLMSYDDFIDETNMVVLCHRCHHNVHYTDNHELSPYRWESATTIESDKLLASRVHPSGWKRWGSRNNTRI